MIPSTGLRASLARWTRSIAVGGALACALASGAAAATAAPASSLGTPSFGHAAIVQRDGEPSLIVDGAPFFFWGGAFFYERLPPSRWRSTMEQMRRLGANTLDLYVPWNWHEIADGDVDFDGHTNPRRNLREVIRLGRELGFHFIVRPGPVVRNEWRNGGYPAWLLQRPEYGMPLHDVLEGRYPATATLQNARSDDAAAEWLANATHLRYAARWLHAALREFAPVADRVIAVQLDDDQGAYLDNQTYPAPNLTKYLGWLEAQARDVIGPVTPTFINTYDMRVPASSPVWTMGNWYQSDAYAIGEHDRAELDFTTAILRTNQRGPLAQSEFQAGWLAAPEDPAPRPADPSNTTLALYELLAWGTHGIVDFPMHDTLAPFGWEAPFANAFYGWDAALRYDTDPLDDAGTRGQNVEPTPYGSDRFEPTASFGAVVARYGASLARTRRWAATAIAYPASSYPGDATLGSAAIARFRATLSSCVERGGACAAVDLRTISAAQLQRYAELIVDDARTSDAARALLRTYVAGGGKLVTTPSTTGLAGSVLVGEDASFLVAVNWSAARVRHAAATIDADGHHLRVPVLDLAPRSALFVPIDPRVHRIAPRAHRIDPRFGRDATITAGVRRGPTAVALAPHAYARLEHALNAVARGTARAYRADVFEDGAPTIVVQNAVAQAVIAPDAGGRMPVFRAIDPHSNDASGSAWLHNVFDATGAVRDDVTQQPPLSTTDRIGKWTRSYPAGMFNRAYTSAIAERGGTAAAYLAYAAPDVVPAGACFERVVSLAPDVARLVVDERLTVLAGPGSDAQRLSVSSALAQDGTRYGVDPDGAAFGVDGPSELDGRSGVARVARIAGIGTEVTAVSWAPRDVESARWEPHRSNGTLRLVFAPGWRRVTYATAIVADADAARRFVEAERAWVVANPAPGDGEVAKWYTQSPQKRPSVSSCGFESHLPQ